MHRFLLVFVPLAFVATSATHAAGMYKCVDAQGNVSYTQSQSEGGECVPIEGARSQPADDAMSSVERLRRWRETQDARAAERAEGAADEAEARREREELDQACATARENLGVLIRSNRVLLPPENEGGEPVRMSDDERMRRIGELRAAIEEYCA